MQELRRGQRFHWSCMRACSVSKRAPPTNDHRMNQQVLLVLLLLALHFVAAYHDQRIDASALELAAGWMVVVIAVNAVYLSANAS